MNLISLKRFKNHQESIQFLKASKRQFFKNFYNFPFFLVGVICSKFLRKITSFPLIWKQWLLNNVFWGPFAFFGTFANFKNFGCLLTCSSINFNFRGGLRYWKSRFFLDPEFSWKFGGRKLVYIVDFEPESHIIQEVKNSSRVKNLIALKGNSS